MNPFSEKKEGIALDRNRRSPAFAVALGGMLAALAVVIMCLGGLIPVATFVCPMLCLSHRLFHASGGDAEAVREEICLGVVCRGGDSELLVFAG